MSLTRLAALVVAAVASVVVGDATGLVDLPDLRPAPPPEVSSLGPVEAPTAKVERIVDGDTFVADGTTIRIIGVDTPETKDPRKPVQCFGREASARLAALIPPGSGVRLAVGVEPHDRYGRTLATVYRLPDGLDVGRSLLADGYAHVLTIPPNADHADDYRAAEAEARNAGRGLWGRC